MLLAATWVTAWGLVVRGSRKPLAIDRWVDGPLLALGPNWQHLAAQVLHWEPRSVAGLLAALVLLGLVKRRPSWAVTVVVAAIVEIVSVQWLAKPLVARYELAPDPSYPSSYVGAATVGAALALIVVGALARGWAPWRRRVLLGAVAVLALGAVAAVSVSAMATAGHRFSDVFAAVPWAGAVALGGCALRDAWSARCNPGKREAL